MARLDQEKDPEVLRQAVQILERENRRLVEKVAELTKKLLTLQGADARALQLEIDRLAQQLAARNKMLFGDSSEKRPASEPQDAPERKPQTGHGPRPQPTLQVVEQLHELDEPDRKCPTCGGELCDWDGQFEESEEIDVLERQFVMRKHRRRKSRCACGHIETAPGPVKLFDGARYSINFAVEVATSKYLDHLPLERQVRVMSREGLEVESQTLWDQLDRLAKVLAPALARLHGHVLAQQVVGADETRWRLMGPKGQDEGESQRWQVWTVAAPEAVCYRIADSRSADAARAALDGFAGVVMCDGYSAYESLAKSDARITLAHCWAHVRRKYLEIETAFPTETEKILGLIGELYAIEKLCPTGPPGLELRAKLRNERSRAVVRQIEQWALGVKTLPESGLGRAIAYMGGIWKGLVRFLDDARIPLDNNATERSLRGVVVGRKNHYGSRSRRGTEVAALFYSLLESAKLAGLEPKAYLRRATLAAVQGEQIPLPHELATTS